MNTDLAWSVKFYIYLLCADTGYSVEDLSGMIDIGTDGARERERERERERVRDSMLSACFDDDDNDDCLQRQSGGERGGEWKR